ncbi:pantoate--beta-alanine ligase [Kurthia sp. 3B1D]|uniref:Pantothenate synthetase n=1 Tax=Candidatus Kurthia intestinigallinarum TaxID=1562256 RepID=A0A433RWN1_9BACL|nr:pantoate--beta-alanine ligase [Kurthia sp. 3B1D]RUS57706.1 pantoate--beta-alanine ligase [Kurthia sp. 3B1D]
MKVITTIQELQKELASYYVANQTIGLVPTMGYLHEGHQTLAKAAVAENDVVVMSDFVNPTQFGPNEDYEAYPRDLERDARIADEVGVAILFAPSVEEMYPHQGGVTFEAGPASKILCGASRPGHFNGVLQIVTKLFQIVRPTNAYFGQKDAQQLALIEMLVRDYNMPITIRPIAIVREEDGLAKSSRNVFLSETERQLAPNLYKTLQVLQRNIASFNQKKAIEQIEAATKGRVDYIELLSYPDLQPVTSEDTQVILAAALYYENVRLIDNIIFKVGE